MSIRARSGALLLSGIFLACGAARAQDQVGQPWTGPMGITESVESIMRRAAAEPPIDLSRPVIDIEPDFECDFILKDMRRRLPQNPESPAVAWWPFVENAPGIDHHGRPIRELDPFNPTPVSPQSIGLQFKAINRSESPYVPPDTEGAVGPTQIMAIANGRIKLFDKDGTLGVINTSCDNFFASVRGGQAAADPRLRFDKLTGKWFVMSMTIGYPNRLMLAVSNGPTINGTSNFTFFGFVQDQVGTPGVEAGALADYPSLGIDKNGVYIGTNMFTTQSYVGSTGWVIRKGSVVGSGPIVVTAFRQICTSTGVGCVTPMGVDNDDPSATMGFFIGNDGQSFGKLAIRRITNAQSTPSISANIALNTPTTTNPIDVPALGSNQRLDSVDDRLFGAMMKKDRYSNERTLWTAHNIQVNSSGVASSSGGRNGMRWYQIRNIGTSPALVQSGTLFDPSSSAPKSYWMGSIAMSGQGHAALGASYAGTSDKAGIVASGRLRTDAAGATQAPTVAQTGVGNYNAQTGGTQRWGDYSRMAVDPTDDQTIWAFQEYCDADNSWATRVVELKAPPPATPSACTPNRVDRGFDGEVVVTGTAVSGSGFYDTEAGYTRMLTAFSGSGITINSVTLDSATQLTLDITVASNAAASARSFTVTNPDGQQTTSAGSILNVAGGPGCPEFSQQPSSTTKCTGQSATFVVRATGTQPITYQWFKNGEEIDGATGFSYQITSIASGDGGVYTCQATNSCGMSESDPATLTVGVTPFFLSEPQDQTKNPGESVTFLANATGLPAPTFQWRRNGANISGATSPFYIIQAVRVEDSGRYSCAISNSCGQVVSREGLLSVFCPADFDGNFSVDFFDYLDFIIAYQDNDPRADFDDNGVVDFFDYLDFVEKFNLGC